MTRFGVNYTPSNGWFHSWLDFSASEVARDMEQIASLGVDHVRIFPLWPLIQPNRSLIRASALQHVVEVVDIAESFGLDVNVDALQGHLSSFDFMPSWLESWHRRNMFTSPDIVSSTAAYVSALSLAVAGRPNLLGVTLGNEVNQFAHAPHPSPHPVSAADADAWISTMVAAVRSGLGQQHGSSALVTVAQYDAAWYDDSQPFGPAHAAENGDATIAHSWVFNGASEIHGALGAGSVRHAEYLLQLAAAWNREAHRPNWLQEVGTPTNVVPTAEAAEFLEHTVRHALDVQDLFGITWWCSHDVSRSLADFPELEYDLGLFTNDGRLKPTGERFAEMAKAFGSGTNAQARISAPFAHALVLDDIDDSGSALSQVRASCAPGGQFSMAWVALATELGRGPQVVLRSRLAQTGLLEARGINTLHRVPADAQSLSFSSAHPATSH